MGFDLRNEPLANWTLKPTEKRSGKPGMGNLSSGQFGGGEAAAGEAGGAAGMAEGVAGAVEALGPAVALL